jgi:hypothetical protein
MSTLIGLSPDKLEMPATTAPAIPGTEVRHEHLASCPLVQEALLGGRQLYTHYTDVRIGEQVINVPVQGFVLHQMASNPCFQISLGAAGVNVAASGEAELTELADANRLRPSQPDVKLVGRLRHVVSSTSALCRVSLVTPNALFHIRHASSTSNWPY